MVEALPEGLAQGLDAVDDGRGLYAEILHYLKAMEALGGNPHDGRQGGRQDEGNPDDDPLFGKGPLRAERAAASFRPICSR